MFECVWPFCGGRRTKRELELFPAFMKHFSERVKIITKFDYANSRNISLQYITSAKWKCTIGTPYRDFNCRLNPLFKISYNDFRSFRQLFKPKMGVVLFKTLQRCIRDQLFITYAKFSKKLAFFTSWFAHWLMVIRG